MANSLGQTNSCFPLSHCRTKDFDFAGAVGAESNGSGDRGHFRRGDGVAKLVPVQGFCARERIGKNLQASVGRPDQRIGRPVEAISDAPR